MSWYEPEELVGGLWDRLISTKSSYEHYEDAAVTFDEISNFLPIFFRTLGGDLGLRFAPTDALSSYHRMDFLTRLGQSAEKVATARSTSEVIALPATIDYFATREMNRDLYLWLAVFFVVAHAPSNPKGRDPLQRDLDFIRWAYATSKYAMHVFPGIEKKYTALARAFQSSRLTRKLPPAESAVEALVIALLSGEVPEDPHVLTLWSYVAEQKALPDEVTAPLNYKPIMPLPLWGDLAADPVRHVREEAEDPEAGSPPKPKDERESFKKAERKEFDEAHRKDPLVLHRFESIQTWAEMMNMAKMVEDDDEESAQKVADEADTITLTQHAKKVATKLKLDLELPPHYIDREKIIGEMMVDEWDYTTQSYLKDYCRIIMQDGTVSEDRKDGQESVVQSEQTKSMIGRVRRQFEALRPKREVLRRQIDGYDLDMDALIMSRTDLKVSGKGSDNIYLSTRDQARDLSVAILVDVSLSTDAWIEGQQVLDVAKETLAVIANGIDACGDRLGIFTFTSRKRNQVFINRLKNFDEKMGPKVDNRIETLKPGFYTRMGAAVRQVSKELDKEPCKHRLLLVLTDGKPNDLDHYEGRYGIEDTRIAIRDARQLGQTVYGVTIDKQAQDYFPTLFGRGSYSIISHLAKLPAALPAIYRSLINQ